MEETAHGPLLIRHSFIHENGIFRLSLISAVLIFLAQTGLAIWLLPFSVPIQISVLAHTVAGLLIVIPLTLWQLSRWLATRQVRRSFRKICAYTEFWTMAVVTASFPGLSVCRCVRKRICFIKYSTPEFKKQNSLEFYRARQAA